MNTEQEIQFLKNRITQLEGFVKLLEFSDRYAFQKNLQLFDGRNIQLGKGTGTKIGTESTQKLGFYGVTPIVKQGAISAPSSPGATYAQGEAQSAVNAINSIRTALQNIGITA